MHLHSDPSLAEVPGFATEQLESLTRSIEHKKQQLENDINVYVRRKQEELRGHERELLEQYRSMERAPNRESEHAGEKCVSPESANLPSNSPAPPAHPADPSTDSKLLGPEEKAKRTKHTRVHKREKELCGLVTPIFLPLLDAGEASPTKRRKEKKRHKEEPGEAIEHFPSKPEQALPAKDAEKGKESRGSRSKHREEKMERTEGAVSGETGKENQKSESGKRSKRSAVNKKSSLRHTNTPRTRRKRVSLVIDDQIVLPADNVAEPPLTSPSETATSSASNSTASLDESIDPRLVSRQDTPREHQDPVHHSLPLPVTFPSISPTKHTGHTLPTTPAAVPEEATHSISPKSTVHPLEYEPPQTATRTFLEHSPPNEGLNIPQYAGSDPIYANEPEQEELGEEEFSTYVGGVSGSGVSDVDQTGSLGYPSSLGASYLESYMQNRPLSVRMAAAEKAGLEEDEKAILLKGGKDDDIELDVRRVDDVDEGMEVIGSMEDF